jgi:hypothetical protein
MPIDTRQPDGHCREPKAAGCLRKAAIGLKPAPISDSDIFRAAQLLIDQHGEEARVRAASGPTSFLEEGDLDGSKVWQVTEIGRCRGSSCSTPYAALDEAKNLRKFPGKDL